MDPSLRKLDDSIINYNKIAHILTPYMAILREAFGLNRLMWGSDWPVSELAVSYKTAFELPLKILGKLSLNQKQAFMGDNALRFYCSGT